MQRLRILATGWAISPAYCHVLERHDVSALAIRPATATTLPKPTSTIRRDTSGTDRMSVGLRVAVEEGRDINDGDLGARHSDDVAQSRDDQKDIDRAGELAIRHARNSSRPSAVPSSDAGTNSRSCGLKPEAPGAVWRDRLIASRAATCMIRM